MVLIFSVLSGICLLAGYRCREKTLIGVGLGFAGLAAMPSAQGPAMVCLWGAIGLALLLINLPQVKPKQNPELPSPVKQPDPVGHWIACRPYSDGSSRGQGELSTF